jgi:hypothetical protein
MRTAAFCAGLLAAAFAFPCAAQTESAASEPPRTLSVAKQPASLTPPQRLAPPDEDLTPPPSAAKTDRAPVKTTQPKPLTPSAAAALRPGPLPSYVPPEIAPEPAPPHGSFSTPEQLMQWVYNYSKRPRPWEVPAAVRAMRELGIFGDEEKAGFCTGFIAGVLGANPKDGPKILAQMFPMPDKEQAVLIRAVAFSGRPDWRELLHQFRDRMQLRQPLIDSYLSGQAKTLMEVDLADGSPVIYTLWGYYVATGQTQPVVRIIEALKWSKKKDDGRFSWGKIWAGWKTDPSAVDKITVGATAKWTLTSYAEKNRDLIGLYRAEYERQPQEIAVPLKDVIVAAEVFESEKVRKDQFGAIADAQKIQQGNEAGMSKAATAGSLAIATGCVAASALGQFYIAVPCVIGGALYTGAMKLMRQ